MYAKGLAKFRPYQQNCRCFLNNMAEIAVSLFNIRYVETRNNPELEFFIFRSSENPLLSMPMASVSSKMLHQVAAVCT